jgi:hypothetical protein
MPIGPRGLVSLHETRNRDLGTWELDKDRKALLVLLRDLQAQILRGERVELPKQDATLTPSAS